MADDQTPQTPDAPQPPTKQSELAKLQAMPGDQTLSVYHVLKLLELLCR